VFDLKHLRLVFVGHEQNMPLTSDVIALYSLPIDGECCNFENTEPTQNSKAFLILCRKAQSSLAIFCLRKRTFIPSKTGTWCDWQRESPIPIKEQSTNKQSAHLSACVDW
jgi:hypothetical protein